MFQPTEKDIAHALRDFGLQAGVFTFEELERYHYERDDPDNTQVRVIMKVTLPNGRSLVMRFKNEDDAPQPVMEAQSRFAALLRAKGIETPLVYESAGAYARRCHINGYDVTVMVEDFAPGELKLIDTATAREAGGLLAQMHNIAEAADAHVNSPVLFDPLAANDLFDYDAFCQFEDQLRGIDGELYEAIAQRHEWLLAQIRPLGNEPRYAVQGDMSDCNLYHTQGGRLGVFDFNRCGDSNLYFDAVMQAVFVARLMDYPMELAGHQEGVILSAFLQGYHAMRPFSEAQQGAFPWLYALITAFWLGDMRWNEGSLQTVMEQGDAAAAREWMQRIYQRETHFLPIDAFLKGIRVIDSDIRLIPYYRNDEESLKWYQDPDVCRQVDDRDEPYDADTLHRMYDYLCAHGDCYYIEFRGTLVGDVSLLDNAEVAIVVCREHQNRHIGRRCVREMLALAREKGMHAVTAKIYAFNTQSRRMFESVGFRHTQGEWYRIDL